MGPVWFELTTMLRRKWTPLHEAAQSGDVYKIRRFKVYLNAITESGETPLHLAASEGHLGAVRVLVLELKADVNAYTDNGSTPLHRAAYWGHLDVARVLIAEFKANVNACTYQGSTPFEMAVSNKSEEVALALVNEFHCDTKGGTPYLLTACWTGCVNVVQALLKKHGTSILYSTVSIQGKDGRVVPTTPCQELTRLYYKHDMALMLVKEFGSSVKDHKGRSLLHIACNENDVRLVRILLEDGKADAIARDDEGNTPLHVAALSGRECMVNVLINEYKCDITIKDYKGRSLLHSACAGGNVRLVRTLVLDHKADIIARDEEGNTPLHLAAMSGSEDVVLALMNEFGCDINDTGHLGRSLLHSACTSNNGSLVTLLSQHITTLVVDDNGDTPLHTCAGLGNMESVKALLHLNPPVMIRNNLGQIPKDLEGKGGDIDAYMNNNKCKFYSQYDAVQTHAKKKYSLPEPITRAFVIGNPGAGKSSLVEALKREGFFDWFWKVSESSVPPHTAGIVPSIHTSKHYGRILFYDFAGDAEYYSSHSAILENLASSRKGDNLIILVVDTREMAEIQKIFRYWLSFVQHQQFHGQKPHLIVVGSHLDLLTEDVAKVRGKKLKLLCDSINTEVSALFMLDCCQPKSNQITEIQTLMSRLTKDSPRFKLSIQASILLGLLEKDFSNVPACSIQTLLTHIKETGIDLPTNTQLFCPILLELHDLGLLFLIDSSNRQTSSVVLNMSQLTNIVHESLFSKESILKEVFEKEDISFSLSAGIIPQSILDKILPENITKECLVQLQYCQEISHAEAHVFPPLKASNSTDQSFLFFPALCSADKSKVGWVTPTDLSYGIGWLARCKDPYDYLSPRFHHVLMLRLVFKFTLSANLPADQATSGSPDPSHFQRRCTVWKTGVHWLMEEGVECMVELVDANKEVVVLTRSTKDRAENCAAVFNDIVSCVMEAKAEFCNSVRLEFFLLDSTSEADYHSADNLFAMRDVERVLTSAEGKAEVIVSTSGKRQMERSKLLCLRNFTLWYSLFPMDFKSVLNYIKDIVKELYMLGLHLGIPKGTLDAIEADNPRDVGKVRRELVKGWMSSSLDPPCWWHLVNALRAARWSVLAEEIATEFGKL